MWMQTPPRCRRRADARAAAGPSLFCFGGVCMPLRHVGVCSLTFWRDLLWCVLFASRSCCCCFEVIDLVCRPWFVVRCARHLLWTRWPCMPTVDFLAPAVNSAGMVSVTVPVLMNEQYRRYSPHARRTCIGRLTVPAAGVKSSSSDSASFGSCATTTSLDH